VCPDPRGCIMQASSLGNSSSFSSCSSQSLRQLLTSANFENCLTDSPSTTLAVQRCGNGIVESGESCDCGEQPHCTNPCCNANTCQLLLGSQCASGECCDAATCQFLSNLTVCRRKTSECDIQETCSGSSPDCPADITVVDGTPCLSLTGYCVGGQCPTHASQCKAAWGKSAAIHWRERC